MWRFFFGSKDEPDKLCHGFVMVSFSQIDLGFMPYKWSHVKFLVVHLILYIHCRLAPSLDPLLSIKFYERTKEQQASLGFLVESSPEEEPERQVDRDALAEENNVNVVQREPHGSVGALAGRRAIAQGKAEDVAAALCRYSAPEEVKFFCLIDMFFF